MKRLVSLWDSDTEDPSHLRLVVFPRKLWFMRYASDTGIKPSARSFTKILVIGVSPCIENRASWRYQKKKKGRSWDKYGFTQSLCDELLRRLQSMEQGAVDVGTRKEWIRRPANQVRHTDTVYRANIIVTSFTHIKRGNYRTQKRTGAIEWSVACSRQQMRFPLPLQLQTNCHVFS